MTLSAGLGSFNSSDSINDFQCRQKALKAFTILETMSTTRIALAEIVNLSANHSIHDRDKKTLQVCSLLHLIEEIAKHLTSMLLSDAFKSRMDIRKKILGNLQPLELKKVLQESPILCSSVFPEQSMTSADELATKAYHTTYKPAYDNLSKPGTSTGHRSSYKRSSAFADPTIRKKGRVSYISTRYEPNKNSMVNINQRNSTDHRTGVEHAKRFPVGMNKQPFRKSFARNTEASARGKQRHPSNY